MGLALRSWLWMAFVTTPATSVVAAVWLGLAGRPVNVGGIVVSVLVVAVPAGVVALGGAVAAMPFTFVLGRLLARRPANRAVHVAAHALLAGVLAALGMQVVVALWNGSWAPAPGYALLVSVPAGLAAAIGTLRHTAPTRPGAGLRSAVGADAAEDRPARSVSAPDA